MNEIGWPTSGKEKIVKDPLNGDSLTYTERPLNSSEPNSEQQAYDYPQENLLRLSNLTPSEERELEITMGVFLRAIQMALTIPTQEGELTPIQNLKLIQNLLDIPALN